MATTSKEYREASEAQAIIESTLKLAPVDQRTLEFDGLKAPYVAGRDADGDIVVQSLVDLVEPLRERPRRRKGRSSVDSALSLVQFMQRYKGPNTTLWASLEDTSASLSAVINDHHVGYDGEPEFADFGATYAPRFSKEWIDWTGRASQAMSQGDFAEFIEERLADIASPSTEHPITSPLVLEIFDRMEVEPAPPARLLQVSRGLRVNVNSQSVNARNLSTGETEVSFKDEHVTTDTQGNKLRVPSAFLLEIPVFDNAPRVQVAAFLRYNVQPNGGVKWLYRLFRPHLVRQEQFMALVSEVGNETGVPVFYGKH